jgi:LPXTG-motif cell wall-anchored protein
MKKYLLSAALLLFTSVGVFAQDEEEHSAEYNWGEKNAIWVILAFIAVIVAVIWAVRRRKRGS